LIPLLRMVSLFLRQFKLLLIYLQKRLDSYRYFIFCDNQKNKNWSIKSFTP
jgi:hypothetical protein